MAEYKCIADDSSNNFDLSERELIVLVPPSLPVIVEPSGRERNLIQKHLVPAYLFKQLPDNNSLDKKLIVGKAGELVCIADGSPPPTYT